MTKPTKKQTTLIAFIEEFTTTNNFSPSYREIMRALGLTSVSAVAEHIDNCVVAGLLRKTPGAPRSLEVIKPVDIDLLITELTRLIPEAHFTSQQKKTLQDAVKIVTIHKEQ